MDINDGFIKGEVSNFVSSLQRLLPKKKDFIYIESKKVKLTRLNDVHAEAKNVFPKCFMGAKINVTREIIDKFKLVQQYNYGKPKDTYKNFSQLIYKEMGPKTHDELLVDSTGSATATFNQVLEGGYEMRVTSRIRDLVSSEHDVVFEKSNKKSVGSLSLSMNDVDPNTLRLVTQWMHKVLPEFSLGAELGIRPLVYPSLPDVSFSARYVRPSFTLSSTINKSGFQVCLFKKFSSDLRVAAIVDESLRASTTVGLALHKTYANGSELKIFVDSGRCGGFTFQKDILFHEPYNEVRVLRLVASTLIDRQKRVRFGFGLNLDF